MERVNHIQVIQVSGSCFICQIDRMLQRDIPDGEGLKLGVASPDTTLIFMIQLGQTGCHFTAARARCCDNDQRTLGFDIFILAIALIADNTFHIIGITRNFVMTEGFDFQAV